MKHALLLLVALTAPALAKRDPVCNCTDRRVLPRASDIDIPTNTLFWRLPSDSRGYVIKPYDLAPRSDFVVEAVRFTTGSGPDHEPPIKPSVAAASIGLAGPDTDPDGRAYVTRLHVAAATSGDTAVVHLHFLDARGAVDYYTTPDQLSVCEPLIQLAPGHVRLEVTALDLAGNESPADTIELDTSVEPMPPRSCWKHLSGHDVIEVRPRTDSDPLVAVALALIACGLYLTHMTKRGSTRAQSTPAVFALAAAEYLARAARRRALATIVLLGAATGVALHNAQLVPYAEGACLFGILIFGHAVATYIAAGRVRVLLRYDGATANVRFDEVAVEVGKHRAVLRTSPRLVDRARQHALPRATL
ncbi:MAG: hypothetical protein JO257_22160 [Deltaproteobacteria bacterium]|nr:hypothetical protein [Deltaproteobacteria bacterium]